MMKIADNIKNLVPYQPGKPISETKREFGLDVVIKLASNENPLGPSQKVVKAIALGAQEMHRYPDPSCFELSKVVAQYFQKWGHEFHSKQFVFGNGSNELIDLVIRCFCETDDHILIPESSFIAYSVCAKAANIGVTQVPLHDDLKVNLNALYETWKKNPEKYKIIFLPNPNNPTGQIIPKEDVQKFLNQMGDQTNTLIVFDEAYFEFVRSNEYSNALEYISKSPQIMVMRTFSKVFGLAGIRAGVLVGDEAYIDFLHRIRNPFNVNHLAQVAVISALQDQEYLERSQTVNWQGLDYFSKEFDEIGIKYWSSEANFVLFDTEADADIMFLELLKQGIILRPVKAYSLKTHLRLSVGLPQENETAMDAIKKYWKQRPL